MNTKSLLYAVTAALFLLACGDASREAEKNLELLRTKALALDSIITVESRRLRMLDSAIIDELGKASKLDSIVTVESRRIDSLINKMYDRIERQK